MNGKRGKYRFVQELRKSLLRKPWRRWKDVQASTGRSEKENLEDDERKDDAEERLGIKYKGMRQK